MQRKAPSLHQIESAYSESLRACTQKSRHIFIKILSSKDKNRILQACGWNKQGYLYIENSCIDDKEKIQGI